MMNKAQRLDAALRGTQEAPPELSGMVHAARQLESLVPTPPLSDGEKHKARQAFMLEAQRMRTQTAQTQTQPAAPSILDKLTDVLQLRTTRRRFLPSPVVAALLLVVCFMLTVGVLDLASQNALPGDGLYGYKLFREQVTIVLAVSPTQRSDSHMQAIRTRNHELRQLATLGKPIPELTIQRLQRSLQDVLQAVSRLPDPAMQDRLAEIRVLSNETLALIGVSSAVIEGAEPEVSLRTMENVAAAALSTESMANLGLNDPDAFRNQLAAPRTEPTTAVPSKTAIVVVPTLQPTLVLMMPSATPVTVNMPPVQPLMPTPTFTRTQPAAASTQTPASPSRTPTTGPTTPPTATDPPPVLPTPTDVIVAPTQAPATPMPTNTPAGPNIPTPTNTPGGPIFPTPTQSVRN